MGVSDARPLTNPRVGPRLHYGCDSSRGCDDALLLGFGQEQREERGPTEDLSYLCWGAMTLTFTSAAGSCCPGSSIRAAYRWCCPLVVGVQVNQMLVPSEP